MIKTQLDPVHFLLVDDLEENLLALDALLRRDDLVLLKARSGADALELLLKYDVALALVDVQMPGMDGFELAELMRGTERTRRVPIIFLTAGTTDSQRRFRGYEAGAVDFLCKPIETDILRSKAGVFFDLYRQRQEVARQRDQLRAATEHNARLLMESRQFAEALKEEDRRKDDFLAMLAHELRNPLAPIRNAVEIMRRAGPDGELLERASDIITRQVTHMARLVDDLLDVARIARGKVELRLQNCDLAIIVRQTLEDYRPILSAAGIQFHAKIPDHALPLSADPTRIAQIVGNLLHNAQKFTPQGGSVSLHLTTDSTNHWAMISVRDTGIGLDPAVLSNIFKPFSQVKQNLDRNSGGLGLGLALVKGLIELHGGSVSAESPGIGKGTTFTLRFRLDDPTPLVNDQKQDATVAPTTDGLRILIVEDNRDSAHSLQMLLTLLGHHVEVAYDGAGGLAAAKQLRPDVVISDLGLPDGMDGFGLAKAMRADTDLQGVLLIALSGYGQEEDLQRSQDAGFDRHLVKPVNPEQLSTLLLEARQASSTYTVRGQE